jgi:predicted RecA/RadA family phage recombinase
VATNRKYASGRKLLHAVASGVVSGSPVVIGAWPGVALTDRDADGNATIDHGGVYELAVSATEGAIVPGDVLYYEDFDEPLTNDSSAARFGYALEAIASGVETTIPVKVGY